MPEQKPKPELLPCPFCGGIKIFEVGGGSCHTCKTCGADGPLSRLGMHWNTRPVSELERLARAFFDKVTEIEPHITGVFGVQAARGYPYNGPNWKEEYNALAAFLGPSQKGKV